jgi:hypothetical protein
MRIGGDDWRSYEATQAWPAGQPAEVQLRDTNGQVLETAAADPSGAKAEQP